MRALRIRNLIFPAAIKKMFTLANSRKWLPPFLLLLSLLVSLYHYYDKAWPMVRRTLFFVSSIDQKTTGEKHLLPRRSTDEENIELLVEEILLGPNSLDLQRLSPAGARLKTAILRDDRLYIDFNATFLEEIPARQDIGARTAALRKSVNFNFPGVNDIYLTSEGQFFLRSQP